MSIYIVKWGGDGHEGNYKEIMIDSEADVANLPTSASDPPATPGSQAYTQDMAHTYLLGSDDVWREV